MKFPNLLIIIIFLTQINLAQTNNFIITCPENTFLGAFECKDIDDIPPLINSIEEATAPPYNIQIEGELPPSTGVYTEDDGVIFFCENDPRLVTREIIFCAGYFGCGGFEPYEILARCSFTIETIPDTIPIEFTPPADYIINCNNKEIVDDEVTFLGEDCFDVDQSNTFFSKNQKYGEDTIFFIRKWITKDICSNYSERKEQIITYSCPPTITDITINCPENTFLGIYDCSNIQDVPNLPGNIEEAIAPPYNIQIEGEITSDLRVSSDDDNTIFYCESDAREVNRSIVIYRDLNFNFVWDLGEEIGWCNYTIETIPDLTPLEITIPPDIELVCGQDPFDLRNTGDIWYEDNTECVFLSEDPTLYEDEVIINGSITTILRTWSTSDPCGNISTPQVQTIIVSCEPECISPNVGILKCGN